MLRELMHRSWERYGPQIAVSLGSDGLTYAEVAQRTFRLASVLRAAGLEPGDRVASLGRNRLESVEEITGVAEGGFVRVPLYVHSAPPVWAGALARTGVRALLVDEEFWPGLRDALAREGHELDLVLVRAATSFAESTYERALAVSSADPVDVDVDPRDVHIIRFSAGTTGVPKPIAHSEVAWCGSILGATSIEELAEVPPERMLIITPYSHGSGMTLWRTLASGGRHVIMPKFDAAQMLELVDRHQITQLFLVATMMEALAAVPDLDRYDLTSVRNISYGTCSTPERLIRLILATFPNAAVTQAYGQSEVAGIVTVLTPDDHLRALEGDGRLLRSAGRALPTTAVRIEDENGRVLPPGEVGEIVAFSPGVMMGIWDDPKATAERITADGWVRTRDLGHLDEDGYLWIADRLDDLIISGGFNVWPAEIENALQNHPAVNQAVVFGVSDERWGQQPVAVVRLSPGASATERELIDWCEASIGKVKRPKAVIFSDEPLPINSIGKLLRNEARRVFWPVDADTALHEEGALR